jgi:flagellar hook assembly protein FlgD
LDEEGPYRINIYNIKGQKVMSSSGEITSQNAGKVINFVWEGTDNNGRQAASGLYFYTLESVSQKFSNKMLLIK